MRKIVLTLSCFLTVLSVNAQLVTVISTDLTMPAGITKDHNGHLYVAEPGTGNNDGRIIRFTLPGNIAETVVSGLPSVIDTVLNEPVGTWRAYPDSNGMLKVIVGGKHAPGMGTIMTFDMSTLAPGDSLTLADTMHVLHVSDSVFARGFMDSNIFSAVWDENHNVYIADAGANAVLRMDTMGNMTVIDTFPPIPNTFTPFPPFIDYVPTKIVHKGGGEFYLANLTGFPFLPGIASVVSLDTSGNDSPYASGLTQVVDIDFDSTTGILHVLSFGVYDTSFMPVPGTSMITRVHPGGMTDTVAMGFGPSAGMCRDSSNGYYITEIVTGSVWHLSLTTNIVSPVSPIAHFTAYPNPASAQIRFAFILSEATDISYEIHDVAGKLFAAKELGRLGEGKHEINLDDIDRLSAGIYIFTLRSGDSRQSVRFSVN